jgi:hypothetical protein
MDEFESSKEFYADYLGLSVEEFNMRWVARYTSPDTGANTQLVTRDATAKRIQSQASRSTLWRRHSR